VEVNPSGHLLDNQEQSKENHPSLLPQQIAVFR